MRLRATNTLRSSSLPASAVAVGRRRAAGSRASRRARARPSIASSTGTSRQPSTARPSSATTFSTACTRRGVDVVGGQERDAGRVRAGGRQLEGDDRAEERVGHLDQDARRRRRCRPRRPAAPRWSRLQSAVSACVDDVAALAALHVDDERRRRRRRARSAGRRAPAAAAGRVHVRAIAVGHWQVVLGLGRSAHVRGMVEELATAGRHWPVGGPEIVAYRSNPPGSPHCVYRARGRRAARREPVQLLGTDDCTTKGTDSPQAVEPGGPRRSSSAHRALEKSAPVEVAVGELHPIEPRAARSRPAAEFDLRRTTASTPRCGSWRRRAGSRPRAPCARSHRPARRCRPGSRRTSPAGTTASEKSQPERSHRTSSTSTRRTRANDVARVPRADDAHAHELRRPRRASSRSFRRSRHHRAILAPDVVTRHARAFPPARTPAGAAVSSSSPSARLSLASSPATSPRRSVRTSCSTA